MASLKVLLFCPLRPAKSAHYPQGTSEVHPLTVETIFAQQYPSLEIVFSRGENLVFDSNGRGNIARSYQKARKMVLDSDYDYLLTVEADMVIPPDALARLLDLNTDVAYGLYAFRKTLTWSAWTELDMVHGRSIRKDPGAAKAAWGKPIRVAGVGTGCALIRRGVLKALDFHTDELHPTVHHDWVFAYELQQFGFRQMCHLGVVCGHIESEPYEYIIWPDPDAPGMVHKTEITEKLPWHMQPLSN